MAGASCGARHTKFILNCINMEEKPCVMCLMMQSGGHHFCNEVVCPIHHLWFYHFIQIVKVFLISLASEHICLSRFLAKLWYQPNSALQALLSHCVSFPENLRVWHVIMKWGWHFYSLYTQIFQNKTDSQLLSIKHERGRTSFRRLRWKAEFLVFQSF